MKVPLVVNKYKTPEFDVYIRRGSYWGNPFPINKDIGHTREFVIEQYRIHLRNLYRKDKHRFMAELSLLEGKTLGCFCKPQACHGDVIVEAFDKIFNKGD